MQGMAEETNMERSIGRLEGKLDLVVTSITGLQSAFDTMEKGRLSRLEVSFNTLQTQVSLKAKSSALWYGLIASASTSVISGVILYLLLH